MSWVSAQFSCTASGPRLWAILESVQPVPGLRGRREERRIFHAGCPPEYLRRARRYTESFVDRGNTESNLWNPCPPKVPKGPGAVLLRCAAELLASEEHC